jgi:hypothetical protein
MNDALRSLLQQPVAYHRVFADVAGDVAGAVWLSWALARYSVSYEDGWFFADAGTCYEATGLTRHQQERIRQSLRQKGILAETRSIHGIKFRLDLDRLSEILAAVWADRGELRQRAVEAPEPISPETGNHSAGNRQSIPPETGNPSRVRAERVLSLSLPLVSCAVDEGVERGGVGERGEPNEPTPTRKPKGGSGKYDPDAPGSPEIPESLAGPLFLRAWREWIAERQERREPLTVRAAVLQLRKLHAIACRRGVAVAVATIERSIENGWTGLFEPEEDGRRNAPAPATAAPGADATALEAGRRRLVQAAFSAALDGEITPEERDQIMAAARVVNTIAEIDRLGSKLPGWA